MRRARDNHRNLGNISVDGKKVNSVFLPKGSAICSKSDANSSAGGSGMPSFSNKVSPLEFAADTDALNYLSG